MSINTVWLCPAYGINQKSETHYTIQIESNNSKRAKVELTFTVKDSLLYMSDIGANQFPKRWANFVHDLKAESKDGKTLKIEEMAGAQWKIHAKKGTKVHLSYAIHLDHEDYAWSGGVDGAAYARDWGVFYTGRSLFIMNGTENIDLKVTFQVPNNWKISTPWDRVETDSESFIIDSQTSLSDSMFFAGEHEELIIKRDQFELVFALGGAEIIAQKEAFGKLATGVLDYYIEIMGGVPNPAPDNKFNKSMVIINSYDSTDGEVIGNNISILLKKDGDQMSELIGRFIFAHEFFHLWNGKSFSPVDNDCEWFKEGFTNYYTLKSLLHVGYLDKESYLNVLNAFFYQKYDQDDGVGSLSMTDGNLKHDHWGLIYSGGLFACISQDMIIRTATKNEKNIDDLMRTLYKKYGGTNKGYSLDEIQLLMTQMSGSDQSGFFDSYIRGHQRIPVGQYLNMGGFEANEANGKINIYIKDEADLETKKITDGLFGIN
jgi:predicted metalloprotease with PDZ domain